jgi:hypothetical protein
MYQEFFYGTTTLVGQDLLAVEPSRSHPDTPHSIGLLWTSDQPDARPLPDKTQRSRETEFHDPGGIRTRNPSKRAATDPHLKPSAHWGWHIKILHYYTLLAI